MREALAALLREPRRTRLQVALAVVAAAAVVMVVAGWSGWEVAATTTALLSAGLVLTALPAARDRRWSFEPPPPVPGARGDLLGLTVAFTARRSGMGQAGLVRVQALGRSRLRRRGLDLDAPGDRAAVEALLGRAAVAVLLSRTSPTPGVRAVAHALARLEALGGGGDVPTAGVTSGSGRQQEGVA